MFTEMDNNITLFIEKINEINSTFSGNERLSEDVKDEYINALLYELGYHSLSYYIIFFNVFTVEQQDDYCRRYILSFTNHYIKSRLDTPSKLISKETFFDGWKDFLSTLEQINLKSCPRIMALKKFYCDNKIPYDERNSYNKKLSRFWANFVCYNPSSQSATIPPIPPRKELYQQELPFYYILCTIYYFSNRNKIQEEPFESLKMIFNQNQKVRNFNNILEWCISCYKEWYTFCSIQPACNTNGDISNISYYISGIPYILEHFAYFWHMGMQWHENNLTYTFNEYDYNSLAEKISPNTQDNYIYFILNLLIQHRTWTQPCITGKEAFCKSRKDEKQRSLKTITTYIQNNLEKYFFYQSSQLSEFFCPTYKKNPLANDDLTNIFDLPANTLTFITDKIREFFSSIFLILSCTENDFLSYINMHIYFNFFIILFKSFEFDETFSYTSLETFIDMISSHILFNEKVNYSHLYDIIITSKNSEEFTTLMSSYFNLDEDVDCSKIYNNIIINNNLEAFTDILFELIANYQSLDYAQIYADITMPLFSKIQEHSLVSINDIENYIYKIYLESFCTDV